MEVLRLRVGYEPEALTTGEAELSGRLAASVAADLGVPVDVELVRMEELLKLGPPQKIPRVAVK